MITQRYRRIPVRLWGALAAIAFGLPAAAQSPSAVLAEVARIASTGTRAAAARFEAPGHEGALDWIPEARNSAMHAMFQPEPWRHALLQPPFTNDSRTLAVFHTWHAPESDCDHIQPLVRTSAGWRLGREIPERQTLGYRISHHRLRIRIVPARKTAEVTDTITLLRSAGAKPVAFVRLSRDFAVKTIRQGAKTVPFRQAGGVVAVRVPPGPTVQLRMEYSGRVDHPIFSAIGDDLAVLNAYYYPTIGRLPATAVTTVVAPKDWKAITQGNLLDRKVSGQEAITTYRNDVPVNYYSLAVGPYAERKRQVGNTTLYTYLLKDQPDFSNKLLDSLSDSLTFYTDRYGPFPYKRYSLVDGGKLMSFVALEGYSFATYGSLMLTPNVIAHELSHTWWGGVVPNTYLGSWWNEGFARFADDSYSRYRNKLEGTHPTDRTWWPSANSVSAAPLSSVRRGDELPTIAYEKGRTVLRLIELEIGVPAMERVLRSFIRDYSHALDPDWPDFRRTLERETKRDWGWFFEQYVNRAGWPDFRIEGVRSGPDGDGYRVTGRLVQAGKPYRLKVPVRVETDGEPVASIIETDRAEVAFEIETRNQPVRLVLDPEYKVPRVVRTVPAASVIELAAGPAVNRKGNE